MPYDYRESTHLSHQDSLALKSLASTGELPNDHYWNALRSKHDANPTRFDKGNYVLAALLDRDQAQRLGTLSASAPLFSNTGFFAYAGNKHTLNMTRFDHWHPFLGRLFEITVPASPTTTSTTATTPTPAGESLTGTSTPGLNPASPLLPAGSGNSNGTGSTGGGGTTFTPSAVPEPASALMTGLALAVVLVVGLLARKGKARLVAVAAQPVVA